jgi:hypothetical protein
MGSRLEDGRQNGAHPTKVGVGWSTVFLTRLRGSYVVQGSPCGPKELRASPQDHGWGSLLQIRHPPWNQQNVSRLEEKFLVDENEERNHKISVRVWQVSKGQGRSSEASWKSATFEHSQVEVEKHMHGLHRGFASHLAWVQLDMGHCRPPDQVGSLYARIHHLQDPTICRALPVTHCPLSWYPIDHYLWQRVYLYGIILGTTTQLFGNPSYSKFSLSPPDWWVNWTSQLNHRGYAPCLCSKRWSKMEPASLPRWVLI